MSNDLGRLEDLPGEELRLPRRSASAVCHVVEGSGTALVQGEAFVFEQTDTIAVPTHEALQLSNAPSTSAACLFMVDDAPLQCKLGIYEVFNTVTP